MKLLAAQTATTATNLGLGKATAVAVYASAISIITVIDSDGTEVKGSKSWWSKWRAAHYNHKFTSNVDNL